MSERKNIERLFQEKFKDFEVEPSEKVWKNIESKLKEKKKNRKVIPFWLKLSGIAATLLIGFLISDSLLNSNKDNDSNVVIEENSHIENSDLNSIKNKETITSSEVSETETEENDNSNSSNETIIQSEISKSKNKKNTNWNSTENATTQSEVSKAEIEKNSTLNPSGKITDGNLSASERKQKNNLRRRLKSETNKAIASDDSKNIRENTKEKDFKNKKKNNSVVENLKLEINSDKDANSGLVNQRSSENKSPENAVDNKLLDNKNQIGIANVTGSDKKTDSTAIAAFIPNALEELLKEKEKKIVTKEPKLNKWQISSNVAPIYYNSASNGSPLDSVFKSNSKDYKTNLAYGLGVKYALNPKFSLRTGVNAVVLEYNTNDVVFHQNKDAISIKHVNNNLQGSLIQIESKNAMSEIPPEMPVRKFDGNLNQKTGYIEIPLELSYKIIDKKIGLSVIGGLSTLFLNENKVSLVSSGMEMNIGEADNLNTMHFSTNVGLGFKYNFLKSFQVNLEPMFKYQINTFSNDSGNFKPYFFGLYTGVSYRF
ncbi:MAG: outer membrane beta-barrel protein [Flavobacterium sp.]